MVVSVVMVEGILLIIPIIFSKKLASHVENINDG